MQPRFERLTVWIQVRGTPISGDLFDKLITDNNKHWYTHTHTQTFLTFYSSCIQHTLQIKYHIYYFYFITSHHKKGYTKSHLIRLIQLAPSASLIAVYTLLNSTPSRRHPSINVAAPSQLPSASSVFWTWDYTFNSTRNHYEIIHR